MKIHLRQFGNDNSHSINRGIHFFSQWYSILIIVTIILPINALRVPSGIRNFWAEDGVIFYSDVINKNFPQRLFTDSAGGGYLNLSGKLIAEFVRFFPIEFAPIINFVLVNLIYAIVIRTIYVQLNDYFKNKTYLFLILGFFVFVPIATFDSIATSINLHFFLLFTSLLILLTSDKKSSLLGHIIVLLTCLSDPLAVLILPAVLLRFLIIRSINKYIVTLALSLLIQFFSVFIFIGNSTREIGHNTSIIKTTYLFMDRVVGSSLIPFWGFVDGNASQSVGISKALLFRLFASFIVLSLCIYIVIHTFTINGKNFHDDNSLLTGLLILTIGLYWSVTGLFFNPEPRYAIFPSLCLITVLLLNLDSIVYHIKSSKLSKPIVYLISFLFIAIAIGSFHASSFRDTNLSWRAQLEEAKSECKNSQILFAKIEIPPERNKLAVVLRCKLLIE